MKYQAWRNEYKCKFKHTYGGQISNQNPTVPTV